VLFGERLDPVVLGQAVSIASASPLLLAIGSSLMVEPAASLCRVAVERGANLVIVNRDETPYDDIAVDVIRADIGSAVPALVDLLTPVAAHRG
jgi:NAD-dependent deacetylase